MQEVSVKIDEPENQKTKYKPKTPIVTSRFKILQEPNDSRELFSTLPDFIRVHSMVKLQLQVQLQEQISRALILENYIQQEEANIEKLVKNDRVLFNKLTKSQKCKLMLNKQHIK
ncbi:Hypothetical_protein [Hexamita inflata]|uniref:Hypothetical_protein n=1 Tax=Hexamita inflata TaxID=28002 RepID=A0AA86R3M3_9EUKA|nr:Hypothetical protein HINF_LOCUS5873 [Hexamita inflata]CAI9965492.1 Hypothetical protein HINF_LOCUS53137 [Hexamita inflata]